MFAFLLFGPAKEEACVCVFCLGGGSCFVLFCWDGDGSSLTYRPAWVVFERPNNKKTKHKKKKYVYIYMYTYLFVDLLRESPP